MPAGDSTGAAPAVRVAELRRVFGKAKRRRRSAVTTEKVALDGVSLEIPQGEVHGLLGPNGAGKTTFCKVLSTVLLPTSGTAEVLGFDVVAHTEDVRRRLGIVLGGERGLYGRLTARQMLRYWGSLHRLSGAAAKSRADELLERVGLTDRADERVETYSRGMKQRLHLARGLVGDPQVLLLDEPTTGMDPVAALEFRSLVGELRGEGRTILLTTHDMSEAETLCDRVTLIDQGNFLATERPQTLSRWITQFERVDVDDAASAVLDRVGQLSGVSAVRRHPDGSARVELDAKGVTGEVLRVLVDGGATQVRTSVPSLEEVYLHVIGRRGMQV